MQKVDNINWFPGHMAKGYRQLKESLLLVDGVLELVDARAPISSKSPEFEKIIGCKKRIILLTKADLVLMPELDKFESFLAEKYNANVVSINASKSQTLNKLFPIINLEFKEKFAKNKAMGMAGRTLKLMVVGIPNVGKSSLINQLAKTKKAAVQNKPGVTKTQQWVKIDNNIELLDTPGILWPKFEDRNIGIKLALIGAIRDEILDKESLALELLSILKDKYPDYLKERYSLTEEDLKKANCKIIEMIGKKRGVLGVGGNVKSERASALLIDEFRAGKIGKVILDCL